MNERPTSDGRTVSPPPRPAEAEAPTYQGSRFPWWLTLLWVAFLAAGVIYASLYFLPDLRSWLSR